MLCRKLILMDLLAISVQTIVFTSVKKVFFLWLQDLANDNSQFNGINLRMRDSEEYCLIIQMRFFLYKCVNVCKLTLNS